MEKLNEEIVAVITAVICEYEKKNNVNLIVKSITRLPLKSTLWSTVGKIERLSRRQNT